MYLWEKIKQYRVVVITIVFLVLIGSSYMIFFKEKEEILLPINEQNLAQNIDTTHLPENDAAIEHKELILVDVKGAVTLPGVYELPERSRVNDAIKIAGDVVEEADLNKVNLAAIVKDGQVVYIPHIGEEDIIWGKESSTAIASGQEDHQLININTAGSNELQKLPGIGPSKAQAILSYREEHGLFKDTKDLIKVSGIGQKTLDKLLPLITTK